MELKYHLQTGGIFACHKPYWVASVAGSSVVVCLNDPIRRIGGMNNFIFPKNPRGKNYLTNPQIGENSIPKLIDMLLEMGAKKENLRAHVLGGSYNYEQNSSKIGKKNVDLAKKFLKKNDIKIVNNDTGGFFGRKVLFNTANGEVMVYKANKIRAKDWYGDKSINN